MSGDKITFPTFDMAIPRTEFELYMSKRLNEEHTDDENEGHGHLDRGDHVNNCKQDRTPAGFHFQEIPLRKIGFGKEYVVDWSKIKLPPKTDLHKLLHYRITNYINPDVLVKIGNHEYRCHSLVLQCYSGFFVAKSDHRVELPENLVTKMAFSYIYDWMLHLGGDSYTLLRRDNVLEIFTASQYLKVKELEEQCWAFIDNEDLFSEERAFMLYLGARSMPSNNCVVMELMIPRIQRFFLTLVASQDFLEMQVEEIMVFLESNYICIHCEMEVFMAAVRWLMHDWDQRKTYVVLIMKRVRFGLIPPWQLVEIRRNQENQEFILVTNHHDVARMIDDGLAYAIIRCWYGIDNDQYNYWCENLNLTEPPGRNWAGTNQINEQKAYRSYQHFLNELHKYREIHILSHKGQGDGEQDSKESDSLEVGSARKPLNTADMIIPHPRDP